MDNTELLAPDLELIKNFRPLKTVGATTLQLICTLGLEITAIVLAIVRPDEKYKCQSYFLLLYIHVALWFVTLVRTFYCFYLYILICNVACRLRLKVQTS